MTPEGARRSCATSHLRLRWHVADMLTEQAWGSGGRLPWGPGGLVRLNLGVRAGRGQPGSRVSVLAPRRGASLY